MTKFKNLLILIFFTSSLVFCQTDLEESIKKKFNLIYSLKIMEDPISVRNLFLKDQDLISDYINFVLNADKSWYITYYNQNVMRRYGWSTYQEFYENRFLAWNTWQDNIQFRFGDYDWFKPHKYLLFPSFTFPVNNLLTELQLYQLKFLRENFYIHNRLSLAGGSSYISELSELINYDDGKRSSKFEREENVLIILTKNGHKYKIVNHPGQKHPYIIEDVSNNPRSYTKNANMISNNNSNYNNVKVNSASLNSIKSIVSQVGSTSSNAVNAGGGTSNISSGKGKQ